MFLSVTEVLVGHRNPGWHRQNIEENRGVFLGGLVSQHVSYDRDVIVALCLISKTRTAVRGKILLKSISKLQLYHSLDTARALIQ